MTPQSLSLFEAVRDAGRTRPSHPAIVETGGPRLSYAELEQLVNRITTGLMRQELLPGETVACALRNSSGYVALILAVARLGLSYVPLLANFDATDVRTALHRTHPAVIVVDGHRDIDGAGVPVVALDALAAAGEAVDVVPAARRGVFRRLWTSGSTGFPKLMTWRQDKLVVERRRWVRDTGIVPDDVFFCRHPLDVAHATDLHAFAALLSGATLVLADPTAAPDVLLDQLGRYRTTVLSALPAHYAEMVAACPPGGIDLSRLRRPLCGGAYLSPAVIRRAADTLGIEIRQIYGSTEFGLALGDMADPPHPYGRMRAVAGVGTRLEPLPGAGADIGELVLASDCTSEGYVDADAANARTFRRDGFWTGDVAQRDTDGTFRILGRVSDALSTPDGPMWTPVLEEELGCHDEVTEAVCVPYSPDEYGDRVLVAVRPATGHASADAVAAVEHTLTTYRLKGTLRCVEAFPRTPVGKVDRPVVRAGFTSVGAFR